MAGKSWFVAIPPAFSRWGLIVALACGPTVPLGAQTLPAGLRGADTLEDSLRGALEENAALKADDARQWGAEARLHGALDAFMPTVSLTREHVLRSSIGYPSDIDLADNPGLQTREPDIFGVRATLNLFNGFKTFNDLQAARWLAEAGRAMNAGARQQLLLDATLSFLAVLRDRAILSHRRDQQADVAGIVQHTQTTFVLHDATATDLALAQSRLAEAGAAVIAAESALESSNIEFRRLTGRNPGQLGFAPPPDALLPRTAEELRSEIQVSSPKLAAARHVANAADSAAAAAWGELSPKLDLQFFHGLEIDASPQMTSITDTTVKLVLNVPLYAPGTLPHIEEAAALKRQKTYEAIDMEMQVASAAQTLYEERKAALVALTATRKRVDALARAAHGAQVERAAGIRTVVDLLNIHNELAEARVALDRQVFERDRLGYGLAAALNRLGPDASGKQAMR